MGAWRSSLIALCLSSGCADILDLQKPLVPILPCTSNEDCGPTATCEHETCVPKSCEPPRDMCAGQTALHCEEDETWRREPCVIGCRQGQCLTANSCAFDNPQCAGGASCCEAKLIERATFPLRYYYPDAASQSGGTADDRVTRSVSPFLLDRFEVTLSRFRPFVRAYDNEGRRLAADSGAHPAFPDSGWQLRWTEDPSLLPGSQFALEGAVHRNEQDLIDDPQDEPARGVNWYAAMAFCIWDGGRLPTEAEWAHAAFADDDRDYPWSDIAVGSPITHDLAQYSDALEQQTRPAPVGSHGAGLGAFGHDDLAGNLAEWVADAYQERLEPSCVTATSQPTQECWTSEGSDRRVVRGGSYSDSGEQLANVRRGAQRPGAPLPTIGFRCARDVDPAH